MSCIFFEKWYIRLNDSSDFHLIFDALSSRKSNRSAREFDINLGEIDISETIYPGADFRADFL